MATPPASTRVGLPFAQWGQGCRWPRVGMDASGDRARHPYSPRHTHTLYTLHMPGRHESYPGQWPLPRPPPLTSITSAASCAWNTRALPPAAQCGQVPPPQSCQHRPGCDPDGFKTRPLRPVEFSTGTGPYLACPPGHTLTESAAFPSLPLPLHMPVPSQAAQPSATSKLLFPRECPVATQPLGAATPPPFPVESWVFTYSLIPLPVAALPSIEPDRCSWVNHNYSAKPCVQGASSSKQLRGPPWRFPHRLTPYRTESRLGGQGGSPP